MQRIASGVLVCLLLAATPAFALEVKIPNRSTAKATIAVDESGAPLFTPANPAQVEVTNFPNATPQDVETFEAFGTTTCPTSSTTLYTGSIVGNANAPAYEAFGGTCVQSLPLSVGNFSFFVVAPCAVCRWTTPAQTFTTYGTTTCPAGTALLYSGGAYDYDDRVLVLGGTCFASPSHHWNGAEDAKVTDCAVCRF